MTIKPVSQDLGPELVFVGTGEALDPALPNTSLLVRGPRTLLLDCGYAVPHAFWAISQDVNFLDGVWISHGHADHCFGLPALLLWMRLGGRERPLTVLGGPGSRARLEQVLELGYPGSYAPHKCYPIEFVELEAGAVNRLGPLELRIAASAHSIVNHALRIDAPGLRSLMYSGDGAVTEGTRALARGVSVLVHECFFAVASGQRKHGDVEGCVVLAEHAGVETLALLHFAAEAKQAIRAAARGLERGMFELLTPSPGDSLALGAPPRT
ncbi:Ribonuclease Z [Enhygromyxa salina]|uniref:Ribonuclease Z n=1 Tax=Enhygromyxa salina TaxID=215803 RepID=A0A2S9XB91_9BACT|nr:ribonuclease Z [Enhygromyxa salina]PRP90124.1 Ribonuclease Z [Enhygromyxa salina]